MDVLWALVVLTMILRVGNDRQKRDKKRKKRKKKNQGQTTSNMIRAQKIKKNNLYDA